MNNEPTMLYVTPREMSNENATYSNKTYQYTHGYGSVITKAGKTDESGYLENTGTDLGDLSKQEVPITQPRIYYGLQTNDPVIINSTKDEFDYIDSTTNEDNFYKYDGDSGITLNFFDRLILGMKEGNLKLATSASIKRESKILTNRNIIQRAKTIMPYLIYDNNPYLVIDDKGNQFWVIDAYTTSNEVPFSQKTEINGINSINYIKNSCKVIINAYDGTTKFYIVDRTDPIIMAYNTIYPEIFSNEKISDDISKHFVYPKYLYEIQMKLIEKYHNIEPEILYRGNDIWQVADITGEDEKVKTAAPYYTVIKDNNNYELGLIIPYSIYKKQNFVSYLIGTYENGEAKLKIKEFSKDDNVLGFVQLESQINQDETIAQEIASLNTSGTKNTKNIFAIPVNNTLLYVETIYQQLINETNQKPTLKRVIVASGNKVAIGNTIDEALKSLVSQYATNINFVNTDDTESILNEIIKTNDNVRNSSKTNDWKLLGEDLEKLTGLIDNLKTTREEQNKVNEENAKINETSNILNSVSNNTIK